MIQFSTDMLIEPKLVFKYTGLSPGKLTSTRKMRIFLHLLVWTRWSGLMLDSHEGRWSWSSRLLSACEKWTTSSTTHGCPLTHTFLPFVSQLRFLFHQGEARQVLSLVLWLSLSNRGFFSPGQKLKCFNLLLVYRNCKTLESTRKLLHRPRVGCVSKMDRLMGQN